MPKSKIIEPRSDWSGGVNVSAPADSLNANELVRCINVRLDPFGGLTRRPGTVLLTLVPFDTPVIGVYQWRPTGGVNQVVAYCGSLGSSNGASYTFHAADSPYATWINPTVSGVPGTSAGVEVSFATFRQPGNILTLFIANNGVRESWPGTGAALTGYVTAPSPSVVRAYGSRVFMNDLSNLKTVFWSKIGDGTDFTGGGVSGGGSALVDTLSGDSLNALETVGTSLLIATEDSISRFTGTSNDQIQIANDSQGVSDGIGPLSGAAFLRTETVVIMFTDRGVYAATEGGVVPIGEKIISPNQSRLFMPLTVVNAFSKTIKPIIGYNQKRKEIWVAYVPQAGTKRNSVMVYNYRLQSWYGPFEYQFGITSLGRYADANGIEGIMCGCDDGHIRLLDDDASTSLDDNQTDFTCVVELAPFGLQVGPHILKDLDHVFLQAYSNTHYNVTITNDVLTNVEIATLIG